MSQSPLSVALCHVYSRSWTSALLRRENLLVPLLNSLGSEMSKQGNSIDLIIIVDTRYAVNKEKATS